MKFGLVSYCSSDSKSRTPNPTIYSTQKFGWSLTNIPAVLRFVRPVFLLFHPFFIDIFKQSETPRFFRAAIGNLSCFFFTFVFVNPHSSGSSITKKKDMNQAQKCYIFSTKTHQFPQVGNFRPVQSSSRVFVVFVLNWGKSWVKVIRSLRLERCQVIWCCFCFAWLEIGWLLFF